MTLRLIFVIWKVQQLVLICDQNNIPNLILKTVSDSIMGGAAEFRSSIEKAADICLEILDNILKEL